jgi:NNP family nitrate/nitrite transporter-like MFS transporter
LRLLFLTLPTNGVGGNFIAFFGVLVLFLTAGLGSASTFQMISVIFRKMTMDRVKAQGGSEEQAMREAATDTRRRWALSLPLARLAASLSRKRSVFRWI